MLRLRNSWLPYQRIIDRRAGRFPSVNCPARRRMLVVNLTLIRSEAAAIVNAAIVLMNELQKVVELGCVAIPLPVRRTVNPRMIDIEVTKGIPGAVAVAPDEVALVIGVAEGTA